GLQAERGEVSRVARDEHRPDPEDVGDLAGEQATRAPERDEAVVAGITAPLHRDLADPVRLVPGGDLEDSGSRLLEPEAEPRPERGDSRPPGLGVERHLPAEQMRRDPPEDEVRVRRR